MASSMIASLSIAFLGSGTRRGLTFFFAIYLFSSAGLLTFEQQEHASEL
jgi:hypothetical protein